MEYTSIYGYIKVNRDYQKSVKFIQGLGKDDSYPFINSNMFSLGDPELPYYYENMVFGFAATYRYFGDGLSHWNDFILKIEHILRNIDFTNAQFHIESAIGDFTIFWTRKGSSHLGEENDIKYMEEYKLTKTEEWYFGFGKRSLFTGYPQEDIQWYEDLRNQPTLGFVYPIAKISKDKNEE